MTTIRDRRRHTDHAGRLVVDLDEVMVVDVDDHAGSQGTILDLADRPLGPPSFDELHDRWGTTSRARLGLSRRQWHHPATRDLVDALTAGADVTHPLRRFGEARAASGLSLDETLSDLGVLAELLPTAEPPRDDETGLGRVDTLRAAAVTGTSWAETFYGDPAGSSCTDTMTGLATGTYLQARLDQLYRQCDSSGRQVRDEAALVVLQIQCRDMSPFACIARRIKAAADLRSTFPGSDTIAVLEPTHAMVVLAANDARLADDVAALRTICPDDTVWVEPLPTEVSAAQSLALELATIPRVATIAHRTDVRHP